MYAVLETGGKQYRVTEGDVLFLERLKGEPGEDVRFDKILSCSNEIETDFGRPYLDDVSVEAKILGHGKNKKIVIFKYKAKKGYRKKQGHRQPYTKVRVERIISQKYGVATYTEKVAADDNAAEVAEAVETVEAVEAVDAVEAEDAVDVVDSTDAAGVSDIVDAADEPGEELVVEVDSDVIIADDIDTIIDVDSYEEVDAEDAEAENVDETEIIGDDDESGDNGDGAR